MQNTKKFNPQNFVTSDLCNWAKKKEYNFIMLK